MQLFAHQVNDVRVQSFIPQSAALFSVYRTPVSNLHYLH